MSRKKQNQRRLILSKVMKKIKFESGNIQDLFGRFFSI